ncbi:MAG TPA: hypothetical protein VFV93_11025 [Thermomicrobiales bacterium]|nr:hypothetical protein [Thermomicrobiales bacterium]
MSSPSPFDLERIVREGGLEVEIRSSPTPADAAHRRQLEDDEARHLRWMTKAIFVVLLAIAIIKLFIILLADDAATKNWARNLFAGIVGLLAGFAGGSRLSSAR